MKRVSYRTLSTLVLGAVLLFLVGACVPVPIDANWADLSLLNGNIVLPFHDRVVFVDPTDGSAVQLRDAEGDVRVDDEGNPRTWQVITSGRCIPDCFYATPLPLNDTTLLLTSYNKRLFEVDIPGARINGTDGTELSGHIVATPVLYNDLIIVPLSEKDVVAFNRDSLGRRPLEEAWRLTTERGVWAQPLLVEGTLYIPSMDHNLYAVDASSGNELWRLNLGGAVASTPLLHDNMLYVGSFGGRMFQIAPNGSITAEYDGIEEWVWGSPTIADGVLYTADTAGFVYALEIGNGEFTELWRRQAASRAIRATPVVHEDMLIVASRDRNLYWLNRTTGEEILRREMRGEVLADLLMLEAGETVSEPLLVVSTMAREEALVAFTVDNGERRWVYSF